VDFGRLHHDENMILYWRLDRLLAHLVWFLPFAQGLPHLSDALAMRVSGGVVKAGSNLRD
jgi:hypothetical protein